MGLLQATQDARVLVLVQWVTASAQESVNPQSKSL